MGRFRGNRGGSNRKNSTKGRGEDGKGSKSSTSSKGNHYANKQQSQGMSEGDRKFLITYLKYYQEGAFAVLRGDPPKPRQTNESEVISDIPLVPLTTEALRQPCLSLPIKLSHKHRKAVHEIATELGLYHASFGKWKQGRRYVAVSIYYDGFRHIPGFGDKEGRQKENNFVLQTIPMRLHETTVVRFLN